MIIEDYTMDNKFSELSAGTCFVCFSEYYMKLYIKYYDERSDKTISYKQYAVNLKTGVAEVINADEKVRVVTVKATID